MRVGVKSRNAYCVGDFRNNPLCLAIVFTVHVVEELLLETLLNPFGPLIERQFLLGGFLEELFSINLNELFIRYLQRGLFRILYA
jgi:hypothetical protein